MNTRRKSTLFLVELLIAIAVFALCAAACINILAAAYTMTVRSNETANALIAAQNHAEEFKASKGILSEGNISEVFGITSYYDSGWQQTGSIENAVFILNVYGSITHTGDVSLYEGEVTVDKIGGENLVTLPVAVRR